MVLHEAVAKNSATIIIVKLRDSMTMMMSNILIVAVGFVGVWFTAKLFWAYIKYWTSPLWSLPGPRDGSFLIGKNISAELSSVGSIGRYCFTHDAISICLSPLQDNFQKFGMNLSSNPTYDGGIRPASTQPFFIIHYPWGLTL